MIEKYFISTGIQYVEIKDVDLRIQCGTPMDSIKQLKAKGFLKQSEIEGFFYESGPNAILLSDLATQNGHFSNLSEFPILHMIYKQGMGIPGHPQNKKEYSPLLIGSEEQIKAQEEYIFWGKTGLCNRKEMIAAGFSGEILEEHWRLKQFFNGGLVSCSREDILKSVIVSKSPKEIRSGVTIQRIELNVFEISYKGHSVRVDLNLKDDEVYELPFDLGHKKIEQEYFSVVNCGDGNGWDSTRTCMGSIITFQDKLFLVDAGPHIDKILTSLGICVSQIDGIFQTHAHDDHFAGLAYLFQTGRKIKYYATKAVRLTTEKKFYALLGGEADFHDFFSVQDLPLDSWTEVDGLHIKACYSPHPVETTIFYFRAYNEKGKVTYGHLADIVSRENLKIALKTTKKREGISQSFYDKVWDSYLKKCDLKKIDCGQGFVHGSALDFKDDKSKKLIISHTDWDLSDKEREIGSCDPFGKQHVLINTRVDYLDVSARKFLKSYFPSLQYEDYEQLINSERKVYPPGEILISPHKRRDYVYLILSGYVEYINTEKDIRSFRPVGSLLGEMEAFLDQATSGTYRTNCYATVLKIPLRMFHHYRKPAQSDYNLLETQDKHHFLLDHTHFGLVFSQEVLKEISQRLIGESITKEISLEEREGDIFYVLEGILELYFDKKLVGRLKRGDPFFLPNLKGPAFKKRVKHTLVKPLTEGTSCYRVPSSLIEDNPVLLWQLGETYKNRLKRARCK